MSLRRAGASGRQGRATESVKGARWRPPLAAAAFAAILVAGLIAAFMPQRPDPVAWTGLLGLYVAVNAGFVRRGTWILLGAFVGTGIAAALALGIDVAEPIGRAGAFAALLCALALLGRVAARSPDIGAGARVLATRPPRSRYVALSLGTHLFAVFLNFGAVLLMTTVLARGRDRLDDATLVAATLAILRGFASMPFWSPLALSVIVTVSIVPQVDYLAILPVGLGFAAGYMLAGYAMDARGSAAAEGPAAGIGRPDRMALVRVVVRIVSLVVATLALLLVADLGMAASVLVASLGLAGGWMLVQRLRDGGEPLSVDFSGAGAALVNETVIVAGAAFAGALISAAVTGLELLPRGLGSAEAAGLAAILPSVMVAAGALAINPIITASVALGSLQAVWPPDGLTWLAISVIAGWGITASGTPFTATVLIAGRVMERPSAVLAFRDNGRLTILALAVAGIVCAAATLAVG